MTTAAWEELRLFDLPPVPGGDIQVDEPAGLSDVRRRTLRNRALIDAGVHPATRLPLRDGATCGSCAHLTINGTRARRFFKCGLVPATGGPGTDVRLSWPACQRWEPEPPYRKTVDVQVKGDIL